jgi:DNA-binding response OmpR family regulator
MYALLLADEADERAVLSLVLQRAGLAVTSGDNLERALRVWPDRPADLILLALRGELEGGVRTIRAETTVPVIAITDQADEDAQYELLEAGADLVAPRPFSARLLIAQVRALSRRAGGIPLANLPAMSSGDLTLDPATRTVRVGEHPPRRLTHLEFRLLYTLMIHRGQVLSSETIVEHVWGYTGQGDKDLVRGLVRRVRTKVEPEPSNPLYVVTIPGLGYAFRPGDESSVAESL